MGGGGTRGVGGRCDSWRTCKPVGDGTVTPMGGVGAVPSRGEAGAVPDAGVAGGRGVSWCVCGGCGGPGGGVCCLGRDCRSRRVVTGRDGN